MMKRMGAIFLPSKEKEIIDALQKIQIGGLTITNSRGKGVRQITPGLGRYIQRYNDVPSLIIIIDDSKVDEIVSIITNAAHTDTPRDGKIFISTIDEVVDIATKQKGTRYL